MDPAGFDRLLTRARRREPEALHVLVDMYSPRVYGLLYRLTASRETAEDLMQETFLRVVRTIGDYQHDGRFDSWLFRIAANLARDWARRIKRRGRPVTINGGDGEQAPGPLDLSDNRTTGPGGDLLRKETDERLGICLQELTEMDREIITLRFFSELPFRDIAEMLGIPLGTALARAHRALKHLRQALSNEE